MSHGRRTINPNGHLEQVHAGKLTVWLQRVHGGRTLQALGAQAPVLGGHGRRKAAEDWLGSDTRPTAAGAGAGTRAASTRVVPTPALPLQPTIISGQLTNAAEGPSRSGRGGLQHEL